MLIRTFWRSCTHRNNTWSAEPVDAFWVEVTREEALAHIFPLLGPEQIEESEQTVRRDGGAAALLGHPNRPYCFLVARDLSPIDAFAPHYPVHPMWNAYSPFETMPAITRGRAWQTCKPSPYPKPATQGQAGPLTTSLYRRVPLNLQHYDPTTLLAGKLHALLQRDYLKGRDVYDL